MMGLTLMDLNEQLAEYFGAPKGQGLLVQEVEEGSSAAKAGVKAGDVLMRIGTRSIENMNDVSRAFRKYDEGEKVEIEVLRKGSKKTMSFEIEEDEDAWGAVVPTPSEFPLLEKFEFDNDNFKNDFEFRIRPKLRELEYKIRTLAPRMEIERRNMERKIREAVKLRVLRES